MNHDVAFDRIDIYTQALNAAFVRGYEATAEPPPIEVAMQTFPTDGKETHLPWLSQPPMMSLWEGYRRYAKLGATDYRIVTEPYSSAFEILNDDLNDIQIPGWSMAAAVLGKNAKVWKTIKSQINLAAGQTTTCYDGSNFFATSHNTGTGNNIVTATTVASDATHAMVALVVKNNFVKPLIWLEREAPSFKTDAGTIQSDEARKSRWWASSRGAPAYGFWHDSVLCKFTGTPTVAEVQTALGTINARFRGFTLPKVLVSDPNQYPHGQTKFDTSSLVIVCSTLIEHIVRQALTLSLISQTENYYRNFADLICSGYLDNVT